MLCLAKPRSNDNTKRSSMHHDGTKHTDIFSAYILWQRRGKSLWTGTISRELENHHVGLPRTPLYAVHLLQCFGANSPLLNGTGRRIERHPKWLTRYAPKHTRRVRNLPRPDGGRDDIKSMPFQLAKKAPFELPNESNATDRQRQLRPL